MVKVSELSRQALLSDIPDELLEDLSGEIVEINLRKGDVLFSEGEETKGLYMLTSGKVEISKLTEDGWKQRLAVYGKGHFIGELSIMERRLHEAQAVAEEDARILLLPKELFERLEQDNKTLAFRILKNIAIAMSKNLRTMNERFVKAMINY